MHYTYKFFCHLYLLLIAAFTVNAQTNITGITINLEGTVMYYTAESSGAHKLYKATKNESGVWDAGVPEETFNKHIQSSIVKTPFVSYDGQTLYFSANLAGSRGFDIFFSKKEGDNWSKPAIVPVINSQQDEMSPSVSANNSTIYFTRNNADGCYNIYSASIEPSGSWSFPQLMPIPVTTGCENYVYVSPSGETLLFSSDRPTEKKKKKYNIFYTTLIANNVWSAPVATEELPKEYNEFYPVFDSKNNEIYVARGEYNNINSIYNIYSYDAPKQITYKPYTILKGIIRNDEKTPIKANITITNSYSYSVYGKSHSNPVTGEYTILIPNDGLYSINFSKEKGSHIFEHINTNNNSPAQIIKKDINLFNNTRIYVDIQDALSNNFIDADVRAYEKTKSAKVSKLATGKYQIIAPIFENTEIELYKENYIKEIINVNVGDYVEFSEMYYNIKLKPDLRSGEINVKDMVTDKGLNAKVTVKNLDITDDKIYISSPDSGKYQFNIRKDNKYSISVTVKDYLYYYTVWKADVSRIRQVLEVKPVPLDQINKIPMPYLNFAQGQSDLSPEALGELSCVSAVLKNNPEYTTVITLYYLNENDLRFAQQRARNITVFMETNLLASAKYKIEITSTEKIKVPDIRFILK